MHSNNPATLLFAVLPLLVASSDLTLWFALLRLDPRRVALQTLCNVLLAAGGAGALDLRGRTAAALVASVLGGRLPAPGAVTCPDDLEWASEAERAEVVARGALALGDVLEGHPDAEGPAEALALTLASVVALTTAAESLGERRLLACAESALVVARAQLAAWREAAGCADWCEVREWTAEICAVADLAAELDRARAELLDTAAGLDGAAYRRLLALPVAA